MYCKDKRPVMNLSSDEDSQEEQVTTNLYPARSYSRIQSNIVANQSISSQYVGSKTLKQQFSSSNAEENNFYRIQQQMKCLIIQNQRLANENQQLKKSHKNLHQQLQNNEINVKQLEQLRIKYKNLLVSSRKTQKQYQNKLTNYQMLNTIKPNDLQQQSKQSLQKIKQICRRFINQISEHKISEKVQEIISNYVKQLCQLNQKNTEKNSHTVSFTTNDKNFSSKQQQNNENKSQKRTAFIPQIKPRTNNRMITPIRKHDLSGYRSSTNTQISQDYRLLQKSIQKLKNMEKDISQSRGSYLKRQPMADLSANMNRSVVSVLEDSSGGAGMDRSKSRRRRIFQ